MVQPVLGTQPGATAAVATLAPLPAVFCTLMGDLLGHKLTSKKIAAYPLTSSARRIVTAYEADDHSAVFICVCDLALAAYAGAALAMLPAGDVKRGLTTSQCEPALLENFAEILNICKQLFQGANRHILPPRSYLTKQEVPPHVATLLSAPKARVDAEITIPGYGSGQMSIVMA